MHLWMLAQRSNLEEPGHAVLLVQMTGKGESNRFGKGEYNNRTRGTDNSVICDTSQITEMAELKGMRGSCVVVTLYSVLGVEI